MSGYLAILESEKPAQKEAMLKHHSELMADAAVYGWESVRAFHAIWLQQLENSCAEWGDEGKKLKFRHAFVWNTMHLSTSHEAQPSAQPRQKLGKDAASKSVMANPGTKACVASNASECETQADHPKQSHVCAYCLAVACKQCAHQEKF